MSNFRRKVERNQRRLNGTLKCHKLNGETRVQMRERIKREKIEKRANLKIKENNKNIHENKRKQKDQQK